MDALHRDALSSLRLTWAPTSDDLWRPQAGLHVTGLNEGPLGEVLDAFSDARHQPESSPLGVVLRGQAGSGKTHMLGQVREQVQADGGFFFIVELLDATSFWQSARAGILESLGRPGVRQETQLKDVLWELASAAHVPRADRRAIVGDDELTPTSSNASSPVCSRCTVRRSGSAGTRCGRWCFSAHSTSGNRTSVWRT